MSEPAKKTAPILSLFFSQSQNLYEQAVRELDQYPPPATIPIEIIRNLFQSFIEGHNDASTLLVTLLCTRQTCLNATDAFTMLRYIARSDKYAAYECALCYIGQGKFPQPILHEEASIYFYDAVKLGHELAFIHMLDAICDKVLEVTKDGFLTTCRSLVRETRNLDIAICLGSLLCGFPITNRHELNEFIEKNPNLGYEYLKFAFDNGDETQRSEAWHTLANAFQRKLFTSESALKFQQEQKLETLFETTLNSLRRS